MGQSIGPYDVILFDYDGCLADSLGLWINAIKMASLEYGLVTTDKSIREQLTNLLAVERHGLSKDNVHDYRNRVITLATEMVHKAPLYNGAKELLEELRFQRKQLGIISSNAADLKTTLRTRGILDCFDVIVTGNDVIKMKPDPEGINFALDKLGAKINETVMVGDAWQDLKAARSAGIDSILYHTSGHSKYHNLEELMSYYPKHIVSSYNDLSRILIPAKSELTQNSD